MIDVLAEVVPAGIAIAVSPAPVLAVLAMLGSRGALRNALAFGLGWAGTIAAVSLVMVATVGPNADSGAADGPLVPWARPVLGVCFLVAGIVKMLRPQGAYRKSLLGKGLDRIDTMGPVIALLVGIFIVLLNPKDLPLTLAGAAEIVAADVSAVASLVAVAVFTVVASSTVTIPVLVYTAIPNRSERAIASSRAWLERNEHVVTVAVFLALGVWWIAESLIAALA